MEGFMEILICLVVIAAVLLPAAIVSDFFERHL